MIKPQNYDSTPIGNYIPVSAGGHKCIIKQVEEVKSSTGKDMLRIEFDMSNDDTQPAYYMNQYIADKKTKKPNELKWRGFSNIVLEGEYATANLKRFVTAVENSNPGFVPQWGEAFCIGFKNAKVGIVFRNEEYKKQDGSTGVSAKTFRFCTYDGAFEQTIPDIKKLPEEAPKYVPSSDPALASEGFMQVVDMLEDEGLPFA